MFTVLVGLLAVFLIYMTSSNGEWTAFWLVIGVTALLWIFGMACREDTKAYHNFVSYWAEGGPDRKRR